MILSNQKYNMWIIKQRMDNQTKKHKHFIIKNELTKLNMEIAIQI